MILKRPDKWLLIIQARNKKGIYLGNNGGQWITTSGQGQGCGS